MDGEEVLAEWRLFKRAFAVELKLFMEKKVLREKGKNCKPPTLEEFKAEMEGSGTYKVILCTQLFRLITQSMLYDRYLYLILKIWLNKRYTSIK